jgi:outer membrane protein insertion porin family
VAPPRISAFCALFALLEAGLGGGQLLGAEEPEAPPPSETGTSETGPRIHGHRFPSQVWIPAEELEAHLALPAGELYSAELAAQALERLLAWKFIESAGLPWLEPVDAPGEPPGRSVDIVWPLVERPLVRGVRIEPRPSGRRPLFSPRELAEGLRTRRGEPLIANDLEADRSQIRSRYLSEGYLLCEVRPEVRTLAPGAVEVELVVEEGSRVSIREIEISGNREIARRHLLSAMETRPALLFGLLSRGVYEPERFQRDLEKARDLYRSRGYLSVVVDAEPLRFSPDLSRLDLSIRVDEGPRYRLDWIRIEGNGPGVPTELLERQLRSKPGTYDGRSLEEDRRRLLVWYQEHYDRVPRIELRREYHLEPEDLRVGAVFEIDEQSHVQTGRVLVEGNTRTRDRVVRSALTVVPGDPLTELAVQESANRLVRLGFFVPEKIQVTAPAAGGTREVVARVEERRTGLIQIGGGASSGQGEIAYFSVTQPNFDLFALPGITRPFKDGFSGGGELLQLEYAPGTRQSQLFFRFEEPYLFSTYNALSLSAANQVYDRRAYDEDRVRGEIALKRFWDRAHRLSTGLGYVLEDVDISGIDAGAPSDVTAARGHTFLAYPSLRAAYRALELDPFRGPAGMLLEGRGELAGRASGSEASFARGLLSADLYQPVSAWLNRLLPGQPLSEAPSEEQVVRLGARWGWEDGLGAREVPIFERFFLGGPQSVRGFDYRGVGPEVNGVKVGGRAFYQGTVEYSFPIFLKEVRGVALFDFADVESDLSGFALKRIRTAAGGGLRFRIPVAILHQVLPVDFYFVEPLHKERHDDDRLFTFTIGFGF